jgi:hypothetical protein
MNRGVTVELDSYRLANYAIQVPCLICGDDNSVEADVCRHCQAPMILAHQAARAGKAPPRLVVALGPSGVGKTVYLGMLLDMLSRQSETLQASARGGFSVALQQLTLSALARGEFPAKTPNEPDRWNWVHFQLQQQKRKQPVELMLPDIAGEALFEEVDHPRTYQIINFLLGKAHGVLILIDATRLESGSLEEDYFTMKLLGHLAELNTESKHHWSNRPVALIFSKADQCETCFDDPAGYAERHAPGLWRICRQRFPKHRFFAAGVAGSCASRTLRDGTRHNSPLRVEPRGIVEPFEWLAEMLEK